MIKVHGIPDTATLLEMSEDALDNRVYERKGQAFTTRQSLRLQEVSGTTRYAEEIARLSGGVFFKLPEPDDLDSDALMSKFHELHAELGGLHMKFHEYTRNDEVDAQERADLQAIGARIHMKMQELLALTSRIYCKDGAPPAGA